jgi:23S rRNA pseudouridine1911/1915/1917 synthase
VGIETYNIIIPQRLQGNRIDFAIAQMLPHLSRSKITAVIKDKYATIAGQSFKAKDKVVGGEIIDFCYQESTTTNWVPSDITLDVVFEDEYLMVINKPAGLITHPGNGNPEGTLANALLHYNKNLETVDRVGIVHRLDKETSGLLVVAKTNTVAAHLINQLKERTISREYNAICYGHMIAGGTIDAPIGRDNKNRIKQAVDELGKPATTHYRVIQKFKDFTLVKALLETGRTHQIRVHLTHIGYPLVGDKMYGAKLRFPKGASEILKNELKHFTRQALHAKKLSFIHPITNETLHFKANLPADMQQLISILETENI